MLGANNAFVSPNLAHLLLHCHGHIHHHEVQALTSHNYPLIPALHNI